MVEVLVWVERKTTYSTVLYITLCAAAEYRGVYVGTLKSAYMKCWWQWYEHRDDPRHRAERLLIVAADPEQFHPQSKLEWYLLGHLVVWLRHNAPDSSDELIKHFREIPSRDEIAAYQTAEIAQKCATTLGPPDPAPRATADLAATPVQAGRANAMPGGTGADPNPVPASEGGRADTWFWAILKGDTLIRFGDRHYLDPLRCFSWDKRAGSWWLEKTQARSGEGSLWPPGEYILVELGRGNVGHNVVGLVEVKVRVFALPETPTNAGGNVDQREIVLSPRQAAEVVETLNGDLPYMWKNATQSAKAKLPCGLG
jgi:hypothetical protein